MDANSTRKIRLIMHLRNMGVTDTRVLSAMEKVPREEFVLPQMQDQAYEDTALPIARGQTISQPLIVAVMSQALELKGQEKILEIGTGSGYQTCILSYLCRRVYTIERHKPLFTEAEKMFEHLRLRNITGVAGDGMKGWPLKEQTPFDGIIVTAAARREPPKALMDQLDVGGIIVIPVDTGEGQVLRRYKKEGEETWAVKDLMPVRFVPLLPDIAPDKLDKNTDNDGNSDQTVYG